MINVQAPGSLHSARISLACVRACARVRARMCAKRASFSHVAFRQVIVYTSTIRNWLVAFYPSADLCRGPDLID